MLINKKIEFKKIGYIDYLTGYRLQQNLFNETINKKKINKKLDISKHSPTNNYLLCCEHPHVYTLGSNGKAHHLLISQQILHEKKATIVQTNRGGDITYHGPGQLVMYPIFDLDNFFTDINLYLRLLEKVVCATLREFNIDAGTIPGLTGVWIHYQQEHMAKKICAIGVRSSYWVTMHGYALNVNTDLTYFEHIIPCGIQKPVTSMTQLLGKKQDIDQVEARLYHHTVRYFELASDDEYTVSGPV